MEINASSNYFWILKRHINSHLFPFLNNGVWCHRNVRTLFRWFLHVNKTVLISWIHRWFTEANHRFHWSIQYRRSTFVKQFYHLFADSCNCYFILNAVLERKVDSRLASDIILLYIGSWPYGLFDQTVNSRDRLSDWMTNSSKIEYLKDWTTDRPPRKPASPLRIG